MKKTIFTIGHSTRSFEELATALKANEIGLLIDVRRFPASKHNPQFNKPGLEKKLQEKGIEYLWMGELLGGFRTGGYEKFMETKEFEEGTRQLQELANKKIACMMCAELLWFRCHRARIAQHMHELGWKVINVFDESKAQEYLALKEFEEKIKPACEKRN